MALKSSLSRNNDWASSHIKLKSNGDYRTKEVTLGIFRDEKPESGRYVFSNDTVYILKRRERKIYESNAWGVLDTANHDFHFHFQGDSLYRTYYIEKLKYNRLYRSNSHTVR